MKIPTPALYEKLNISKELNSTSLFMLPTVMYLRNQNNIECCKYLSSKYGFVNAYIDDHGFDTNSMTWKEIGENFLYLLFDPIYTIEFDKFEKSLRTFSSWRDNYDIENGVFTMHVFEIPDIHADNFKYFLEGKYSKINKELSDKYSDNIKGIVKKDPDIKRRLEQYYDIEIPSDSELHSKIDLKSEIFRFDETHISNSSR